MSLLELAIRVLTNIKSKREKSTALVHVPAYEHNGAWSQEIERGSSIVRSYHYRCNCGQEYMYRTSEAIVSEMHMCGACGKHFNLLLSLKGREDGLSRLPIRSLAVRSTQPTHQVVGESKSGEVTWTGAPPSPGVQWR
jgi:hypothetical protein